MRESDYQPKLIRKVERLLPGCIVIRLDPRFVDFYIEGDRYSQGVMDILIIFEGRVAVLEVKRDMRAEFQPNQDYFLRVFGEHCFAAPIYPEIEGDVLHDLQSALRVQGASRRIS